MMKIDENSTVALNEKMTEKILMDLSPPPANGGQMREIGISIFTRCKGEHCFF